MRFSGGRGLHFCFITAKMYREALRGRGKLRIINNVENYERMGLPIKINLVNRGFDHDHGLEGMKIVVRN